MKPSANLRFAVFAGELAPVIWAGYGEFSGSLGV